MGWFGKKKEEPARARQDKIEAESAGFEGGVALVGRHAMVQSVQAKPELNGLYCTIRNWIAADPCDPATTNRFEVDVIGGAAGASGVGTFKLKLANLNLKPPDALGQQCSIAGLKSREDLNGARGSVLRWVEDKGRYEVTVASELVLVKRENIVLPGDVTVKKGR